MALPASFELPLGPFLLEQPALPGPSAVLGHEPRPEPIIPEAIAPRGGALWLRRRGVAVPDLGPVCGQLWSVLLPEQKEE